MLHRPGRALDLDAPGLVRVAVVPVALLAGALVVVSPIAAGAFAGIVAFIAFLGLGRRIVAVFHGGLVVILIGYAFLGRGFAYLGLPPLYVGEMVTGLAIVSLVLVLPRARFGIHHVLLVLFMLWGAARTIPYIGLYGIDALRDAATWYYAIIAIAVSVTLQPAHFVRLIKGYRGFVPIFLAWAPIFAALNLLVGSSLPKVPFSSTPILVYKAGDTSVHLAAIAAFIMLGLYARSGATSGVRELLLWAAWLASAGVAAALNRAALLAIAAVGAALLFVRESSRWLSLVFVAALLTLLITTVNPQAELGLPRNLSAGQLVDNITSIFSDQPNSVNQATKEWRTQWWNKIISYTVNGPYFWTGKGFGINLADDDGFQVTADGSLRAPHSTHFEILARSGVPGLVLWIAFQLAFGLGVLRAAFRAYRKAPLWVPILGWVFIYWLAALTDGSFDVYLGGPQGGIWFWSVIGVGIAAMRLSATNALLTLGEDATDAADVSPAGGAPGGAPRAASGRVASGRVAAGPVASGRVAAARSASGRSTSARVTSPRFGSARTDSR